MFSCFTDKKFLKKFLMISAPVMISQFISFLVSFLDNVMVGSVSNEAVSGVYAANEVTYLFNLAIFGLLEGIGIFVQQFNGTNDENRIKQCFKLKIIFTFIFMLIVMPLIYFFGKYIIMLFSYKDSDYKLILNEGEEYLKVVAISYIPFAIGDIFSSTLRETGKTKYSMTASLVAVASNFLFNLIFIVWLKQGAVGAGYATIISRCLEALYLIFISYYKKFSFCISFIKLKVEGALLIKILKKSYLLFINEIGFSVGVVLQSLAFSHRDGVLSAISIVSTVSNIFSILISGLSIGIGVIVGSSLGKNSFDEAIEDNKKLNLLGFYMALIVGVILIALSLIIPNMFSEVTSSQKSIATKLIIIYGSLLWANCLSLTSYFTLKVGGQVVLTFILDSGLMLLLYIPLSWILAYFTNLNIIYIYLIIRGLDVFKGMFGIFLMKRRKWVVNLTNINVETTQEVL